MSVWLTEKEFRQSGAQATGITINVAFLREIKDENVALRQLIDAVANRLGHDPRLSEHDLLELFSRLRDELESYFALEEFYGYFDQAAMLNPSVSACADKLRNEHESLFLSFNDVVELVEQHVYRESNTSLEEIVDQFNRFRADLDLHEQCEMELMLRLCNEEIGVGD